MRLGSTLPSGLSVGVSSGSIPLSNAILNSGSAWCAAATNVNQYLQVDLGRKRTVTGIAIQGNPSGTPKKWVKTFYLKYGDTANSPATYPTSGAAKVE